MLPAAVPFTLTVSPPAPPLTTSTSVTALMFTVSASLPPFTVTVPMTAFKLNTSSPSSPLRVEELPGLAAFMLIVSFPAWPFTTRTSVTPLMSTLSAPGPELSSVVSWNGVVAAPCVLSIVKVSLPLPSEITRCSMVP